MENGNVVPQPSVLILETVGSRTTEVQQTQHIEWNAKGQLHQSGSSEYDDHT